MASRFISSVDTEVLAVNGDNARARIKLAHADEPKVNQIGLPVGTDRSPIR
jgi:hypothetical protein